MAAVPSPPSRSRSRWAADDRDGHEPGYHARRAPSMPAATIRQSGSKLELLQRSGEAVYAGHPDVVEAPDGNAHLPGHRDRLPENGTSEVPALMAPTRPPEGAGSPAPTMTARPALLTGVPGGSAGAPPSLRVMSR